jgi:hypothetical protein
MHPPSRGQIVRSDMFTGHYYKVYFPSFSNNLVHTKYNKAEELQLVCRSHRVLAISRELPNNIILHILIKVHIFKKGPKLHKFCEMLY